MKAKTIGHGTYSVVKECMHIETGQYYAAKIINKRLMSGREHMVKNEIVVLKRLSEGNRNILTLVDYFETTNDLYLITDLARGGELFDRIYNKGAYYESDAIEIVIQVCTGVAYLHDHGIVHRDIKPENLLFMSPSETSELLIADFGLSRIIDEEKLNMLMTTCGTPSYMSPEMFQKTGHGKPVDMWAIGVITYFLLCGYNPFDRDTSAEEMQAVLSGDYDFEPEEEWKDVSDHAKDFINKCLKMHPSERITAAEALDHPFLKNSANNNNETDLLPRVMSNLNLRRRKSSAGSMSEYDKRTLALRELKESGCMDGAFSTVPEEITTTRPVADDATTATSGSSSTSSQSTIRNGEKLPD